MKIPEYIYEAVWSEADSCYLGTVMEFPDILVRGKDVSSTIQQLKTIVRETVDSLLAAGQPVPNPFGFLKED